MTIVNLHSHPVMGSFTLSSLYSILCLALRLKFLIFALLLPLHMQIDFRFIVFGPQLKIIMALKAVNHSNDSTVPFNIFGVVGPLGLDTLGHEGGELRLC